MRDAFRALAALLMLVLAAASAPAARAAVPASGIVLEIFPLAALGKVDPAAGVDLSARMSDEIAGLGGIALIAGSAATPPAEYGVVARAAGAGYYLTGSLATVGSGVAAIVQIVGTRSGTVVWSTTAQLATVADIAGVGAEVRTLLLAREQRSYTDLGSPAAPPPSAPKTAQTPTPVTRPLPLPGDATFDGARPAAAADAPVTVALGPGAIVVLGFTAPPSPLRDVAERSLLAAFAQHKLRAGTDPALRGEPIAIYGDRICSDTAARAVLSGTVALDGARLVDAALPQLATARVQLLTFDCATRTFDKTIVRSSASLMWTTAVQSAVSAAAGALAANPKISGGT